MKFALEGYSEALVSEMRPLWEAHHAETADEFYGKLDPNLSVYASADASGILRVYTLRDEAGSLHGYQVFFLANNVRWQSIREATQDIFYVCDSMRQGLAGLRFLKWCAEQLREDGVQVVHQIVPANKRLGLLFRRLGYRLEDEVYSKRLQEVA